jgi:uncharacterized protein YfiM (DUF2279 family)
MRIRGVLACMLAAFAASSNTGSLAAEDQNAFSIAIASGDSIGAAKEIERLADQQRGRKGVNTTLDAYYGRFFASVGQGAIAEPYLGRAILASQDRAERDRLTLDLAQIREVRGFISKATADYRSLMAPDTNVAVRSQAALAMARLALSTSPSDAESILLPLVADPNPPAVRWEANLLVSRAFALEGRSTESSEALSKAWQLAVGAAMPANAIAVTAMDMALDRAASGDRKAGIGLISVGRSASTFAGLAQLPVCGTQVHPDDSVTVAITADAMRRTIYSAVRASRPGIAQLFTVPLASALQQLDGPAIYVALRCRSTPSAYKRSAGSELLSLPTWLAEKGFYPSLEPFDFDGSDPLTRLKQLTANLETKVGKDSPVLAPQLLQLSYLLAVQSRFGTAANFQEAKATAERAIEILVKARAPEEVLEQSRTASTVALAQNQNLADVTGPASIQLFDQITARPTTSPDQAFAAYEGMTSTWRLRPNQRLALIDRLVQFLDVRTVPQADPIRQGVELRRAAVLREIGTIDGLKSRLTSQGIAADLCDTNSVSASFPPAAITLTSDDYPKDLIQSKVSGASTIELSIDASGKIAQQRMIVSQPPGLFDAVTDEKLKALTLIPAQQDGKPLSCRGKLQTVVWRLPDQYGYPGMFDQFSAFGAQPDLPAQ